MAYRDHRIVQGLQECNKHTAVEAVIELETWTLEKLPVAARSQLYQLEPIGIGSAGVESLTGYIARLADAHCVSVRSLLLDEVFPRFPHGFWTQGSRESRAALCHHAGHIFDSAGGMTCAAINALQEFTQR